VDNAIASLSVFAEEEIDNGQEIEKLSTTMMKQQEILRKALRRKEQAVLRERADGSDINPVVNGTITATGGDLDLESAAVAVEDIQKLFKEERYLRAESARLEAKAERLMSRSKKLLERSEVMEVEEEEAYKALEEGILAATKAAESGQYDQTKVGKP